MEKNEYKDKMFEIADAVTMQDVLNHYGFRANRPSGRIPCPFHHGKNANLGYSDKAFSCFVCGAKGNVISFVSLLFNEPNGKAAQRIDADFNLNLFGRKLSFAEARQLERNRADRFREETRRKLRDAKYIRLCSNLHYLEKFIQSHAVKQKDIDGFLAIVIDLKTSIEAQIEDLWEEMSNEK